MSNPIHISNRSKCLIIAGYLFFIFISLLACPSCKDNGNNIDSSYSIVSFNLIDKASSVSSLIIDEERLVIENTDSLIYETDLTQMIAQFKVSNPELKLRVGDKEQVSGLTFNDFSSPVRYDLYKGDVKQKSYEVRVIKKRNPTNDFNSFSFSEPSVAKYSMTIDTKTAVISNGVEIPQLINVKSLIAHFSTVEKNAVVTVGGVVQESGISVNDFTNPVEYIVRGQNASTKKYIVNLRREARAYFTNPVLWEDVPDPTVIRVGNEFYMYGTGGTTTVYKSKNLVYWDYVGLAFTPESRPNFEKNAGIWAPDINYFDNHYILYYSMSVWGGGETCGIGVAVSDKPEGPFETISDGGKMFRSNEIGVHNSIDPCIIEDYGKKYMFWGSFNGIYAVELTTDGLKVKDMSQKKRIAGNAFEAAYVHKRGGYFYLFASIGACCEGDNSTYKVVVGRSANVLGPYVNKEGKDMLSDNYELLIRSDNVFAGPGHNSRIITDDNGTDWILYHSYLKGQSDKGRLIVLDHVSWSDGWPSISNGVPSKESELVPFFNN